MLFRLFILVTAIICSLPVYAASGLKNIELRDLYFGEVLYYAYQDRYFDALARLDVELSQYYELDEPKLDRLYFHIGQAEFSVGDLELQYRMNQRAGNAIQAVLGKGVDLATRNMAALQLARLFYRKNDPQSTLYALNLIRKEPEKSRYQEKYSLDVLRGKASPTFKIDVAYLRARALIETGQFSKAVDLLQELKDEDSLKGFVHYNLGIALIQSGREEEAMAVLDELGRLQTDDPVLLALKDKTNLKLAYRYLDRGNSKKAKMYFERIRLDGPFSNRALLGAGWVAAAEGRYDRALVPWSILHKRSEIDASVQEALMAVPYAYSKLQAYGNAANLYNQAMDVFAAEIDSLDSSIKSIRQGKFLTALLNEKADKDRNWVVNLRELPDSPETRYILELMASSDFQQMYKNYRDLADLRHHLDKWLADLRVFEEMIEIRRKYHEPLLPVVQAQFKKIDARVKLRLEQRENLAGKLKNLLISPRPEYLATATERRALDTVMALEAIIKSTPQAVPAETVERVRRMRGILLWQVRTEYDQRLTDAYNNLIALDKDIDRMKLRYNSFIRTRQAATQSYEGYTIPIRQLRTRLFAAQRKLKGTMAKQGHMLETMAINELDRRRKRLEEYQIKARFALAENYDRATKAQFDEELKRQQQQREKAAKPEPDAAPAQAPEQKQPEPAEAPENTAAPEAKPASRPATFKQKLMSR